MKIYARNHRCFASDSPFQKWAGGFVASALRRGVFPPLFGMIGTGEFLVLAKRRGLIGSASVALQAVMDAGLWLSDGVVDLLKKQAGE